MDRRLELRSMLVNALGSENVYFQPPETRKINYPAIIYHRSSIPTRKADDMNYIRRHIYEVTLVEYDADSPVVDRLLDLPRCTHERHFVSDNLYHDIFRIYY